MIRDMCVSEDQRLKNADQAWALKCKLGLLHEVWEVEAATELTGRVMAVDATELARDPSPRGRPPTNHNASQHNWNFPLQYIKSLI